jgi:hypothetical protein
MTRSLRYNSTSIIILEGLTAGFLPAVVNNIVDDLLSYLIKLYFYFKIMSQRKKQN